jgi:hypothetical protein
MSFVLLTNAYFFFRFAAFFIGLLVAFFVSSANLAAASRLPKPRTAAEKAAVARAANLVPATERMVDALAPLAGKLRQLRVHLIGHSHIGLNWLWTWPDTVNVVRRNIKSVLALMDEFPQMTFSHSQAIT